MADPDNTTPDGVSAKRYLGSPCPKGHGGWRYIANRACVDCNAAAQMAWEKRNRAKIKARKARKRDHELKVRRSWEAKNRDRILTRRRARIDADRDTYRRQTRSRRCRVLGAEGSHTTEDVAAIRKAQRHRCAYCRCKLPKDGGEVDHIVPLARGGSNDRRNLQLLCCSCNRSKGARHPIEHARRIGLLL